MSVKTAVTTLILVGVSYVEASASIGYTNVSVTAVTSSPAISVSVVSGSPDVKYVDPIFALSYIEPKAVTTYIDVDVVAVPSKPAVIQVDVVNPLDNTVFGVVKNVPEIVVASDTNKVSFAGSLEDQVYLAETFVPLRFISRLFTDDFSAADASAIGFGLNKVNFVTVSESGYVDFFKGITEPLSVSDELATDFNKVFENSVTALSESEVDFLKPVSDLVVSSDIFDHAVNFQRALLSSVAMVQLATTDFSKVLEDSVTSTTYEVIDFSLNAPISSVVPNDTAQTTTDYVRDLFNSVTPDEFKQFDFGKVFSHSVTLLDTVSVAVDYSSAFTDNITLSDTVVTVVPIVRSFADAFTLNEYLSKLNEAPINAFVVGGKYGGETVVIAMARVVPPITDTTGTSDSGMWVLQDYTSADYFAQDYVGTKGTI